MYDHFSFTEPTLSERVKQLEDLRENLNPFLVSLFKKAGITTISLTPEELKAINLEHHVIISINHGPVHEDQQTGPFTKYAVKEYTLELK